ncbi:hypothetical protein SteCoe_2473 [Stentor coeruleus]|uniref:Uncharacterized protein n=1 Tax=Stentor coeruleus TaxID=5963 RepID=A0A1R2CZI8_9CILI|nr:hypothetical protein SteCoe_2473 [Stentor coeruleus]
MINLVPNEGESEKTKNVIETPKPFVGRARKNSSENPLKINGEAKKDKHKAKEKKNDQKFRKRLRKTKENVDEFSKLVAELCKFSRINTGNDMLIAQYYNEKISTLKYAIPPKYTEIIQKTMGAPPDDDFFIKKTPNEIISTLFNINLLSETSITFRSGLSIDKIEHMLEKRIT